MPRGCLQFVIVVFPDHTHLLFFKCFNNDRIENEELAPIKPSPYGRTYFALHELRYNLGMSFWFETVSIS